MKNDDYIRLPPVTIKKSIVKKLDEEVARLRKQGQYRSRSELIRNILEKAVSK